MVSTRRRKVRIEERKLDYSKNTSTHTKLDTAVPNYRL